MTTLNQITFQSEILKVQKSGRKVLNQHNIIYLLWFWRFMKNKKQLKNITFISIDLICM